MACSGSPIILCYSITWVMRCAVAGSQRDVDLHAIEAQYARKELSDENRMYLAFGLGKAYGDLGEYREAMQYYLDANN